MALVSSAPLSRDSGARAEAWRSSLELQIVS
jgi:hypothetical protein